ncbi:hypothetical protein KCH_14920 [Kitasatospora cheerisanensis KCTC 2395]|uniref:Uncharacterized protein n=1 Tax=Kitasatospora cheerisanensis KCTC 2395 TaxID=1348663 RepID=A0A066YZ00_9ACTN|nr:hypothetical protein KCH_14920 [Kitasatospora cheerisanensis KCTC 2395]
MAEGGDHQEVESEEAGGGEGEKEDEFTGRQTGCGPSATGEREEDGGGEGVAEGLAGGDGIGGEGGGDSGGTAEHRHGGRRSQ